MDARTGALLEKRRKEKKSFIILYNLYYFKNFCIREPYNKEYKNLNLNNGIFYNGLVRISPGIKQYSNILEIKENSITGATEQIIVKCIEKTKVYVNFKETAEDDNTQYIINANCEFIASGKVECFEVKGSKK